ncbi:MAG TPA: hypothetical protein VGM60_25170 [Pseudonocardia sp.]|uniref:hypothetical protein n=1 Tax=Pseudonocardia sp. TaxID=60912 RepID=UPI002F41438E
MRCCRCGLDLEPPTGPRTWRPLVDRAPVGLVQSVAICGVNPWEMRWVCTPSGWLRFGVAVPARMQEWAEVGMCPAGVSHPVIDTAVVWCPGA